MSKSKRILAATRSKDKAALIKHLKGASTEDLRLRWGEFGYNSLMWAVKESFPEGVALLLKAGADPNWRDSTKATPMHAAAVIGNEECIRALFSAGADLNLKDDTNFTPLMCACLYGEPNTVDLLLNLGADPRIGDKYMRKPSDFVKSESLKNRMNGLCAALDEKEEFSSTVEEKKKRIISNL